MLTVTVTYEKESKTVEWHSAKKLTATVAKRIAARVFPKKDGVLVDHSEQTENKLVFYAGFTVDQSGEMPIARKI